MTVFKSGLRAVMIVAAAATMAGCASQMSGGPNQRPAGNPADIAARAAMTGDYQKAAQQYIQAAGQASQPDQQRQYRLEAGLAAAQAGDAQTAQQMLSSIQPATLNKTDQARYNLAQREIEIADLSPDQALARLPRPARNTAPEVAQRVWEKRAELHFANNEPVQGIQALAQRDVWLMDDRALRNNDDRIYDKALDTIALGLGPDSRVAQNAGQTTRGWLALAQIGQSQFSSRQDRDQALADWQSQYPGHPANRTVLTERFNYAGATEVTEQEPGDMLSSTGPAPQVTSDQIALALPMNGRFQNAAQAIRDGFMFAYQNNGRGLPKPIIYQSGTMPAQQLASQAQMDNVGVLVGPLDKSKVAEMSRLQSLPMPEIALNSIEDAKQRPGFYQFGLSPEDEAESTAAHAERTGYSHALALVPRGDWGNRVLDAFRRSFKARGGQLVDYQSYNADSHDHSQAIQAVLKNQGSADFIFVAAQPTQARLIRSQLKYYRAADLPMLTTSHAFSGTVDAAQDIDLNGVHFVDMPWLLGQGGTIARLRSEAKAAYGREAQSYARLFAMGMDAWLLARRLDQGDLPDQDPIEGMTGVLSVQPDGHIKRYLGWAVFRNGRPQTVSMPSVDDARIGDSYSEPTTSSRGLQSPLQQAPNNQGGDRNNDPWSSSD
ncbi:penicillin-binding protein activator [Salinisphaera sp. SPP-AMP-43]|uniref:penicillin-binding protein activator n=1 Tax=Salinisphaera sp. SPP-AMP-43 TaxID=3121288 RepID=UPI003C6E9209